MVTWKPWLVTAIVLATMAATKNGDITTVRIGAAEVYSIPDAFVFGG